MLATLPPELVERIALHLLATHPVAPPLILSPLLATSNHLRSILLSPSFLSNVFHVCFDSSSVRRRNFTPSATQFAEQLGTWCRVLNFVRGAREAGVGEMIGLGEVGSDEYARIVYGRTWVVGDGSTRQRNNRNLVDREWEIAEMFMHAMLMLMEDDGHNRAQLEAAGLYPFVKEYLTTRLYTNTHNGWPVESLENSCALWVLWMLTTEERLRDESQEEKERMINLVLPFVLVPYRYSSAHAPPSHYTLPLSPTLFIPRTRTRSPPTPDAPTPAPADPATTTATPATATATPTTTTSTTPTTRRRRRRHQPPHPRVIPAYTLPHSVLTAHAPYPLYPSSSLSSLSPNHTLHHHHLSLPFYGSYTPLSIPAPPSLPAKLLYFSRRELLGFGIPPHLLPTRADAERRARERGEAMPIGPTQEDVVEFNRYKGAKVRKEGEFVGEGSIPPSVKWDNDYFRSRYCYDVFLRKGRRNGDVYTPGMLDGLWHGRMLVPSEQPFLNLITNPTFPPNFSEEYFLTTTVPVYMRLREYHWVAGSRVRRKRVEGLRMRERPLGLGLPSAVVGMGDEDLGTRECEGEGEIPSTRRRSRRTRRRSPSHSTHPSTSPSTSKERREKHWSDLSALISSFDLEESEPGGIVRCAERRNRIDEGMRNAWFPEGTVFVRAEEGIKVYVPPPSTSQHPSQIIPSLYERYRGNEANSHDSEYCGECLRREAEEVVLRRLGGEADEDEVRRRAGGGVGGRRGRSEGGDEDGDDGIAVDEDQDDDDDDGDEEEEDALIRERLGVDGEERLWRSVGLGRAMRRRRGEMGAGLDLRQDVDRDYVQPFGIAEGMDVDENAGEEGEIDVDGSGGGEGGEGEEVELAGDQVDNDNAGEDEDDDEYTNDLPSYSDADLPMDDPRKAPPCHGIRDIIVEGETDLRHGQAWNHFIFRGRIRSWDGLVGVLRISRDRRLGDIFFYGYIVGGESFVGNWRIAHADVSAPAWESAFSLSKRE